MVPRRYSFFLEPLHCLRSSNSSPSPNNQPQVVREKKGCKIDRGHHFPAGSSHIHRIPLVVDTMNSFALRKAREQTERRTSDVEPPPRTKIAGDSGKVIVVVDPYSTGVCVAQEAIKRGYKVVVAWTKGIGENKTHIPASCADVPAQYYAEVDEKDSLTEMAIAVHEAAEPYGVAACVCGGESGVAYCDALSEKLEVRSVSRTYMCVCE